MGVGGEFGSEDNGEVGATEKDAGDDALECVVVEPFAEADRVPVEDESRKKRTAEEHHDEVAIERATFRGSGNVVKRHRAVTEAKGERANAGGEEGEEFAGTPAADVGRVAGEARIDVMKLKAGHGGGESVDEGLHHQALAVDGWRGVSEDEKLQRGRHSDDGRLRRAGSASKPLDEPSER